uniref:Major facilitator superfamily associated domain-containing protein n=1 Tax=Knipowitschia caucasica TaxID=637954 RepID=A0AAV2KKF5_KNICA
MLNAVSFGALWWAVQVQCDDIATPGTERSVARVYNVLCLDVGRALGSVIAGLAAQRFGIAWMFRGAALGLIVWCCVLALLQVKAPRQRRINYSRLLAADASENSESDSEPEKDWLDKAMVDDWSNNNSGRRMHH